MSLLVHCKETLVTIALLVAQASPLSTDADNIEICMVGDILLHDPIEEHAVMSDGNYDFSYIFANTRDYISSKDIAIVNQEVIIGGQELGVSGYPTFNAPYDIADDLVESGFDVVCQGTNHALDRGKSGIVNCLNYWQNTYPDIEVLGIHDSFGDQQVISVVESQGYKIAILNYTYGTNGIELPKDMLYGVDYLNESRVVADIAWAKVNSDFVIVCPHWGTEYNLGVDSSQRKWADIFLKNGVDLVIGTHPHVMEPVELLVDEATGHQMVVFYSLGNYVSWTSSSGEGIANRFVGGMADVTLTAQEGRLVVSDYKLKSLVTHIDEKTNLATVYFLDDYSQEMAEKSIVREKDSSFSYDYCVKLFERVTN
ncbi:MAG: CapA family protein [Pseudobutyrivibrio sp.]|nr:CapA family protein [Pseudobutyrivibrio sp.]